MPTASAWASFWILLLGLCFPSQGNDALVGTWKGQDGTIVVLDEDGSGRLSGIQITWRATGKDRLRIKTPEGSERGRYTLDGNTLTTTFSGETQVFTRQGESPSEEPDEPQIELPAEPSLPSEIRPSLRFEGEGIALQLRPAPPGFEGFLERDGKKHEVRAVPHRGAFYGAFLRGTETVEFHTEKTDTPGSLDLVLGTDRIRLTGTIVGAQREVPPDLQGVAKVEAKPTRFQHSRGFFTLDLPAGWTIAEETEDGLLINPGLQAKDTLDALIVVQYGRLDDQEANRKPHEILDGYESEIRKSWREQNVRLEKPDQGAKAVRVGKTPGAEQEWTGKSGKKDCRFWLGGLTERDCYLTVGILTLEAEQDRFLPQTKRLFTTIRAKAPKREPALEALLAGRRVSSSSTNSSGFFGTTYDFYADGTVRSAMMFSGGFGVDMHAGGNVEEDANYEVIGDTVYMYFRDKQESGRLVLEDGRLVGIRFGQSLYPAN